MTLVVDADVVLVDIEGTISSLAYVNTVLYGYARARIPAHVAAHRGDPVVEAILADTAARAPGRDPVETLIAWQDADLKVPPLKTLQGLIWEHGYREGAFQGHIYPDALAALHRFRAAGLPVFIFSSGSVKAQVEFFRHAEAGDLRALFDGHFDTDVGAKVDPASYRAIAGRIGAPTGRIVFFTDNPRELEAATAAGLQVVHVVKDGTATDPRFPEIADFGTVEVARAR